MQGPPSTIRAQYPRALILGVAGLTVFVVVLVGAVLRLMQSFSGSNLFSVMVLLMAILLGLLHVFRSRPTLTVSEAGVRQLGIGRWYLAWNEIRAAEITSSEIVFEPSTDALQSQSVRFAAQWSRVFAPGRHPRGVIVLPRPRLGEVARRILRAHGVVIDTDIGTVGR